MAYYLKKPRLPSEVNGHAVTYQSDRVFYEKQAHDNPLSYGEIWRVLSNFGGMWLNLKVLAQNTDDEGFIILQFYGMSNSGKSYLAYAKAWELMWIQVESGMLDWVIYHDAERTLVNYEETEKLFPEHIHLVHNWSQILVEMDGKPAGDIIVCDEESTRSGQESATESNSLKNILRACRAKRLHFFFIDPEPEQKPNTHAWIKCIGKIKDIWTTMSIVEDAHGILVGLDFHQLPIETSEVFIDMMIEYEIVKHRNIDALLAAKGRVGSAMAATQHGEALTLYEAALERQKKTGLKMNLKRLSVLMVDIGMMAGTGPYREQLMTRVMDMIRSGTGGMLDPETDDENLIWDKESVGEEALPAAFHEQLAPHLYRWADKEGIEAFDVALLLSWFEGETQDNIAEENDMTQKAVSIMFKKINRKILGYACEDWLAERNPHWTHVGGNTPACDFENDSQVISIKATSKKHREFTIKDTGLTERETVIRTDKEFLGWQFHVRHNRIRKIRWTVRRGGE
jgi:hypothetical protein